MKFQRLSDGLRGFPSGTTVASRSAVSKGASPPIAAAILGLLVGTATPARAQSEPATGEAAPGTEIPAEAPTIEVVQAPTTPAALASEQGPPPPVPHWVHRRRRGLVAAGAATFGASYGVALFLGLATWGSGAAEECSDCASQGAMAVVPIAGPLLYWRKTPEYFRGSALWWSIWSGVQAAGAGMLIAGLVGHDVVELRPRYVGARVNVVPVFAPKLGALSLNVSW